MKFNNRKIMSNKKKKGSRSFRVLENELLEQGLISDRSKPRELYTNHPRPVVDVKALEKRISALEKALAVGVDTEKGAQ